VSLIALGVTGGVGAYKAVEVCRGLQKRGHDVVAVMTRSAARFVGPVTFEAITRRPVITSQWRPGMNADIEHIAIADGIALLLVAPCTANVIGKFANGIADDFLSSLYLATKAPVLIAPAMNVNMLAHEAVQRNLQTLSARGVQFVEPGEGYLACGWIGKRETGGTCRDRRGCRRHRRAAGNVTERYPRGRHRGTDLRRHRSSAVCR
jgi:phosphopantothenoylcysteine decarboxylase/phosphopantothenate--cysteine ligase